jgi:hypothetical protein
MLFIESKFLFQLVGKVGNNLSPVFNASMMPRINPSTHNIPSLKLTHTQAPKHRYDCKTQSPLELQKQ